MLTCAPNFPKGKIYEEYRNWPWQIEIMDGIRVVRVWTYITANEGFAKRILDYMSFMVSATLVAPFVRRPDVVVGTSPHFFTACAAWAVSRLRRVPFVFELRDLWPESVKAVGAMKDSSVIRFLERVEMFLYRKAARIVPVTESFKRVLEERGVDPGKITVVTNGVDMTRFRLIPKDLELAKRYGLEGKFVAGYIGTHGMAHALETVLAAADLAQRAEGGDVFRFVLLGDGARKSALIKRARQMGLENMVFVDSVSKEDVVRYWSLLDVSVIHLRKTELFTTVIPSKLFECMGMGIPVLLGVAGESAKIVEREGCGLCFEPENARQLWECVRDLRDDRTLHEALRANALCAARRYDRRVLAEQMAEVLKRTARIPSCEVASPEVEK